jgi:hypothetical protein
MPDQIVAKDEANYELPPPDQYQAVCVDVIDLGMQVSKVWGDQHKIALVFQLDAANKEGKRFQIASKFTLTMSEKGFLRKFLGQWRGRQYTDAEAKAGVPLDKLCGVNAFVSVDHTEDGKYANIVGIFPLPKNTEKLVADGYVRSPRWAQKRDEKPEGSGVAPGVGARSQGGQQPSVGAAAHAPVDDDFPGALEDNDDDLPF